MEFSFGTLELNRTSPYHLGTGKVLSPLKNAATEPSSLDGDSKPKGVFATYLSEAVESMNAQQTAVSHIEEQIAVDPESVDIHDVTIAMAKAKASMDLAHTVISRIINGWTELSQNR